MQKRLNWITFKVKFPYLNSHFAITPGYLNPPFNNPALVKKKSLGKIMKLSVESIFLDYAEFLKFPLYHETANI